MRAERADASRHPAGGHNFLDKATTRRSYADLVRAGEDLSDFDCYACHDKKKPPPLRLDTNGNIIVAKEHPDIVMGHGSHGRNNNCFNCHNETNLVLLQPRDGRELKFEDSPKLCGSCHGPTYRDWEAGAHGRTSGYWDRSLGPIERKAVRELPQPSFAPLPFAQARARPASVAGDRPPRPARRPERNDMDNHRHLQPAIQRRRPTRWGGAASSALPPC
jgi:uncharacterized CHY-type Zn-finger protein